VPRSNGRITVGSSPSNFNHCPGRGWRRRNGDKSGFTKSLVLLKTSTSAGRADKGSDRKELESLMKNSGKGLKYWTSWGPPCGSKGGRKKNEAVLELKN